MRELTPAQGAAIAHIKNRAKARRGGAVETLSHVLKMSNIDGMRFEHAFGHLRDHARVALHFHPDRLNPAKVSSRRFFRAEASLRIRAVKETFGKRGSMAAPTTWRARAFPKDRNTARSM